MKVRATVGQTNKWGYGGSGDRGDSLGAISHIKLSQGAFRGNPPVSLVPPVSLLDGFPDHGLELESCQSSAGPRSALRKRKSASRLVKPVGQLSDH